MFLLDTCRIIPFKYNTPNCEWMDKFERMNTWKNMWQYKYICYIWRPNVYLNSESRIACILIVTISKNWTRKPRKLNDMCMIETCWSVDLNQLLKPSQKKKNQKLNLFEQLLFTQVQKDLRETFHDETIRLPDILTSLKAIFFCFTENASMS